MKEEVTKLQAYRREIKTESESRISTCQICGKEITFGRIFCEEHDIPINKQIYEFFSEFPKNKDGLLIRPRGEKLYQVIKYYLAARLELSKDKRVIMKSCTGAGKSVMLDMLAFIEMTHFPNSLTIIGSISEAVSKMHIERLREWIGGSVFNRYMVGTQEATASKTEIKLAKLNSKVMAMPQSPKSRTGWHASLLLVDEVGRMDPQSYYASFSQMAAQGGTEVLACFDEETEVMCRDGFKKVISLSRDDVIATLNLSSRDLEYQKPIEIYHWTYDGDLIEYDGKNVNFAVTPNHNIFYLSDSQWRKGIKNYKRCIAWDLQKRAKSTRYFIPVTSNPLEGIEIKEFVIPSIGFNERKNHGGWKSVAGKKIPMDTWLEFLGYYLSEGYTDKSGRIVIGQKKFKEKMFSCTSTIAQEIGRKGTEYENDFQIGSQELSACLGKKKRIPDYVFQSSLRQRKIFLDAFDLGDGSQQAHKFGNWVLYFNELNEYELASDFQRLFIGLGNATTLTYKGGHVINVFGNRKTHTACDNRNGALKKKQYSGNIVGIHIPNNTLFVRRNGKISVSGNSTPYLDSITMQNIWNSDDIIKIALEPEECFWIPKEVFRKKKEEYRIGGYSALYEQLYGAQFRSLTNRVIPDDLLLQSMAKGEHYPTSKNLIMGIDFGKSIDFTAIVVIDIETGDIKFVDTFQDDWPIQFAKIRKYAKEWNPIKIVADSSHIGDVILSDLRELNIEGVSMHNDILKKSVIDRLIMAFFNNKLNIVSEEFPKLINEVSSYVYYDSDHKKMGPSGRGHDDTVIALSLALRGLDVTSVSDSHLPDNLWSFTRVGERSYTDPWKISNV